MPLHLEVVTHSFFLDCGSLELKCLDELGEPRVVHLHQRAFPQCHGNHYLPGRLYLDGEEIPIRSDQETQLLQLLRTAKTQLSGDRLANGSWVVDDVVEFVSSVAYLEFAARVDEVRLGCDVE
jgi:hypothetical protein